MKRQEINNLVLALLSQLLVKPDGAVIMNTERHKLGVGMLGVVAFTEEGKKKMSWAEVEVPMMWDIHDYLEVALKMKPELVDSFVELESAEDKRWYRMPEDIVSEDKEIIGRIGVAKDMEHNQGSVLLVSPDGTWCTLTVFRPNLPEEVGVAKSDLRALGEALINYAGNI